MTRRTTELVRLCDIRGAEQNPKEHDLGVVGDSIDRLRLIDLPVIDGRTGRLVAGHGRVEALRGRQETGEGPPEGVELDEDGEWLVPAVAGWASKNDDEATAAGLALNAWIQKGGWNADRLAEIRARLEDIDASLASLVFVRTDLSSLIPAKEEWSETSRSGGAGREESIDELAENYRNKQVRTIVLDYPIADYRRVVALADQARKRHKVPGNAELLMVLLRRYATRHPG